MLWVVFVNKTAPAETDTYLHALSLHDALPILGDMPRNAERLDPHIDRAAPADLDRIAQPRVGRRLADQAEVGTDIIGRHPVYQRYGAVGGGADRKSTRLNSSH